jgi:EcsC protein family
MPPEALRPYDEQVLHELIRWKNPPSTFKGRLADRAERVLERIVALVPTKLVEQVLGVLMPRVARITAYGTSSGMVINAYGRAGHDVGSIDDIARLPLEAADRIAGDKRFKEGLTAAAEGGAAGFVGGPVLIADIAACGLLAIRAAQSRALVYGFDPRDGKELAHVLEILDAASRLGPESKQLARRGMSATAAAIGSRQFAQAAIDRLLERLPKLVVTRLAGLKSESAIPVVGAVTSASFNAWYLQGVTRTAHMAYRERFLRRVYGDELVTAFGL